MTASRFIAGQTLACRDAPVKGAAQSCSSTSAAHTCMRSKISLAVGRLSGCPLMHSLMSAAMEAGHSSGTCGEQSDVLGPRHTFRRFEATAQQTTCGQSLDAHDGGIAAVMDASKMLHDTLLHAPRQCRDGYFIGANRKQLGVCSTACPAGQICGPLGPAAAPVLALALCRSPCRRQQQGQTPTLGWPNFLWVTGVLITCICT